MAINRSNQLGSGFTNLQRILQANQSNRLGQTVGQGIMKAGETARTSVGQAGEQFQQGIAGERSRLASQANRVTNVLGNIPGASEEDVKQFESIRGGESKGPKDLDNYGELRSKAEEAKQLGKSGSTEGGRLGLLQRFVGRGQNYGAGQQRLDNLLLGQTGAGQLRQARAATQGVVSEADRARSAAQAVGQEVTGEAQKLRDQTIEKLKGSVTDYDTAMANQLATEKARREGIVSGLLGTSLEGPAELDEKTLSQLAEATGGSLGEGKTFYSGNYENMIKANLANANKQAAQNQADFNKIQMLSRLSGQDLQDKQALLEEYTGSPSAVGQFNQDQNVFQVDSPDTLAGYLNTRKGSFEGELARHKGYENLYNRFLNEAQRDQYSVTGGEYKQFLDLANERANLDRMNQGATDKVNLNIDQAKAYMNASSDADLANIWKQIQADEQQKAIAQANQEKTRKDFGTYRVLKKKS